MRQVNGGRLTITDEGKVVITSSGEEVPADEPLFLLRARDPRAEPAISFYADGCRRRGFSVAYLAQVHLAIAAFLQFRHDNPDRMQAPDSVPDEAVHAGAR